MSRKQTKILAADPDLVPPTSAAAFQTSRFFDGTEDMGRLIQIVSALPAREFSGVLREMALELQACARLLNSSEIDPDLVTAKKLQVLNDVMGLLLRVDRNDRTLTWQPHHEAHDPDLERLAGHLSSKPILRQVSFTGRAPAKREPAAARRDLTTVADIY